MAKAQHERRALYIRHERKRIKFEKPTKVKAEFQKEADINLIMDRFKKSGVFPTNGKTPMYMDTTQIPNLQTAMQVMIEAEKAFLALPAKIRKEFDNNPMQFVEYASDVKNLDKLREWGLAKPEEKEKVTKVEVINQPKDTATKEETK